MVLKVARTLTALRTTMNEKRLEALVLIQAYREQLPITAKEMNRFASSAAHQLKFKLTGQSSCSAFLCTCHVVSSHWILQHILYMTNRYYIYNMRLASTLGVFSWMYSPQDDSKVFKQNKRLTDFTVAWILIYGSFYIILFKVSFFVSFCMTFKIKILIL